MNCIRSIARLVLAALLAASAMVSSADEAAEVRQLVKAGQSAQAMAKVDEFLALKPKDPQLRFLKGVLLADGKQTAAAIAVFTQLTEDYPELPEPYNNLAVIHASQGNFDMARSALEAAVRGNPGYAIAYENLGDVYARLAVQAWERALSLDAANAALAPKISRVRALFAVPAAAAASGAARSP